MLWNYIKRHFSNKAIFGNLCKHTINRIIAIEKSTCIKYAYDISMVDYGKYNLYCVYFVCVFSDYCVYIIDYIEKHFIKFKICTYL